MKIMFHHNISRNNKLQLIIKHNSLHLCWPRNNMLSNTSNIKLNNKCIKLNSKHINLPIIINMVNQICNIKCKEIHKYHNQINKVIINLGNQVKFTISPVSKTNKYSSKQKKLNNLFLNRIKYIINITLP